MVLVATQVKRRRGTTAENDAFTGAEGEITVDTEKHQLRVHDGQTQGGFVIGQGGGSGSGRNIGDIFYTTRKDTALAGAVECNGGTYNTADYTGEGSIGELLESGVLPYISLTDYQNAVSTIGTVGVFGWDGEGTTTFRVPKLANIFIEAGTASVLGNYIPAGLPNITGDMANSDLELNSTSGAFTNSSSGRGISSGHTGSNGRNIGFDASRSNSIYGNSNTVQPNAVKYRAMVQLATGATDEALEVCTQVLADVADLKDMSNVTSTGKETVVGWGMPDYSAGVALSDITPSNPYTATVDCVLYGTAYNGTFFINGNIVAYGDGTSFAFPVTIKLSKGDTITTTAIKMSRIYMIPLKGVN